LKHEQTFTSKRNEQTMIGYLSTYHGYPNKEILYLGFLFIDTVFQRKGFAKEVVVRLSEEAKSIGYTSIRINVALKNWPAMRFWVNNGFRSIIGVHGDREIGEDQYAFLELEKIL
jgi:ribosomal protein S18 acetylase RimI-like enzyme